jgi:hypothetical protein
MTNGEYQISAFRLGRALGGNQSRQGAGAVPPSQGLSILGKSEVRATDKNHTRSSALALDRVETDPWWNGTVNSIGFGRMPLDVAALDHP